MTQSQIFDRFLCFSLGVEEYAVPLLSVREVIGMPDVTPIPFTPNHFKGIMNLRGQVISVIDLRTKFNIKPSEKPETSVIICDIGESSLGVVVDSVNSVIHPEANEISSRPTIESSKNTDFISGVYRRGEDLVLLLDVNKALSVDDRNAISKAKAA
jgi:purine-binding chemotaxis protein CheW